MSEFDFNASALRTIQLEADAVAALATRIDGDFTQACQLMLQIGRAHV